MSPLCPSLLSLARPTPPCHFNFAPTRPHLVRFCTLFSTTPPVSLAQERKGESKKEPAPIYLTKTSEPAFPSSEFPSFPNPFFDCLGASSPQRPRSPAPYPTAESSYPTIHKRHESMKRPVIIPLRIASGEPRNTLQVSSSKLKLTLTLS